MTQTYSTPKTGLVVDMRKIRDQISQEIQDMTFEQERAYLHKLLTGKADAGEKLDASQNKSAD